MQHKPTEIPKFKIGDRVINVSGDIGTVVLVVETERQNVCYGYCVEYDHILDRVFLNREVSLNHWRCDDV